MSDKVSIITILHGDTEFIPIIHHNYTHFLKTQELELVIVDDGRDNLMDHFVDLPNCLYLHLSEEEILDFMGKIVDGYKEPNKSPLQYQQKLKTLPNGFLRDYGCGLSTHPTLFHMNSDCLYHPKAIDRKCRFMKRVGAECSYCDTMLCHNIYNKELYKTESPYKIYEGTLCHTRDFWKRRGFQWSDIEMEGKYFHYNNGNDRKLDNYYDTIQLLSIHNLNMYKPVQVTLDNIEIKIPEIVSTLEINTHPFVKTMDDLYGSEPTTLMGINSDFLENMQEDHSRDTWVTHNITEKWKQKKLPALVMNHGQTFNVLMYGSKHPTWSLFEKVPFDIIFLETMKNYEQMIDIIAKCKTYTYLCVKGVFVRQDFLSV